MKGNRRSIAQTLGALVLLALLVPAGCSLQGDEKAGKSDGWSKQFGVEKRTLSPTGKNRYFVLEPGFQIVLQGPDEKVIITVLDETKVIGGIVTRVLEEREEKDGRLAEVSKNFFAVCEDTGDVFYFGEDVDDYEDGKVVRHSGQWRAYEKGARPGLMMPGEPSVGAKYYQEIAPGKAMDRAEIVSLSETFKTPAGTFADCLKVEETSGRSPGEREYKTYAPGVGMIQDEDLLIIRYGFVGR
ncbi:MAG: hypothetical protein JSU94_20630 [Phycisphaerales bacterium]|nr:MAG: hypothetical protein JSU94_20630 [Phycisphaerales bacterium]